MMQGPRSPVEAELPTVLNFLNNKLRSDTNWSIAAEYPTALTSSNIHNMRIITEQDKVVSHAVLKPLIIKSPQVIFKVGAIGSVVTDQDHRNKGLSTQILEDCIRLATQQQCDVAILWTNLFEFYQKLGFTLAGTEISLIFDQNMNIPNPGLRFSAESKVSAEAIHRIYATHTVSTVRTVEETRKYMSIPQTKLYTAWEANGQLAAYAIEGKGADLSGYIHEWGGSVSKLLPLLSWIARERNMQMTIIAPKHSQNLIQQLKSHGAMMNEGYLGMIKILNFDQLASKIKRAFRAEGIADIVLEKNNDHIMFGFNNEIFTLNSEADVTQFLFGPVDIQGLDMFSQQSRNKLAKILPLNLWIWGWDSI